LKRLTLYTKSGCTSCNRARQFLLAQGVHYAERDIFKHPLNETELRRLAGHRPLRELFSFRSPSAKALGLLDRNLTDAEMIAHMLSEPRLIRRPLAEQEDAVVVGYDEAGLRALLQPQGARG
jgi:Spx/MgsR family transcriptional regulator